MARADRRLAVGGTHHVHNRGVLRRALLAETADQRLFMGTLRADSDAKPAADSDLRSATF